MKNEYLLAVKEKNPLIHCITNYVTVNDCANALLAIGASPVMADDVHEVQDMTALSAGLVINIGTLNEKTIESMKAAGEEAAKRKIPCVLDAVGAGATEFRTEAAKMLLTAIPFTVIRGNASEIKAMMDEKHKTQGVDVSGEDEVTKDNLKGTVQMVKSLAKEKKTIVAMSGVTDIVTDGTTTFLIDNGDKTMRKVTGTGCMLSVLTAAFVAASPNKPLEAVKTAFVMMGYAGEIAKKRMKKNEGTATYRIKLLDALSTMTEKQLEKGAKYECC